MLSDLMTEPVTACIGIASLLPDEDEMALCMRAEQATKSSKEKGINQLTVASAMINPINLEIEKRNRKDTDNV